MMAEESTAAVSRNPAILTTIFGRLRSASPMVLASHVSQHQA